MLMKNVGGVDKMNQEEEQQDPPPPTAALDLSREILTDSRQQIAGWEPGKCRYQLPLVCQEHSVSRSLRALEKVQELRSVEWPRALASGEGQMGGQGKLWLGF